MPQTSIAYAVGRVRAAQRKPLGDAQQERLLSASSYQEALSLLNEMGWQDSESSSIAELGTKRLEDICNLLKSITPEAKLTDAFLLRHDAQNLKALLKARVLGVEPESLSNCGTMDINVLRHAVTEHDYRKLPASFQEALAHLERRIALQVDPMEIDVKLDQALFTEIFKLLKGVHNKAVKQYFTTLVDFKNAVAYFRMEAMKQPVDRFLDLMLPGGKVDKARWTAIIKKPEGLLSAFADYDISLRTALASAQADYAKLPALEKRIDDHLLSFFRPYRNEPYAIEVLIGWLLAFEREVGAVRLIMAGKLNEFPEEVIRERLRVAYGR